MRQASLHCQVPCGIYDDARRFKEMQEDARSVAKAVAEIQGHAEQVSFGGNKGDVAYHMNQSVRVSLDCGEDGS